MAPKLIYFPIPGRAGAIREAFKQSKIEFEDIHVTHEEFAAKKAAGEYTFGQLPVLILEDGTQVSQSTAILRWVGQQGGLYPSDATQALKVDEILDVLEDIITLFRPTMRLADEAEKKSKQQEIVAGPIIPYLKGLEALATRNGANGHFVGDSTTVADIKTAAIFSMFTSGMLPGVESTLLDAYPNLKAVLTKQQ